ncbi:hypothetical protein [Bradyrhizobium sp. LLZ17]|uniref:hypothetical protein n=1 Tax=Bradyrhizobium sp. LLZ17 TaxID=3239388 RepID=UPI00350FE866
MADLKRDMAILATSGPEWAERTKRLAARVPGLDIFSHGLVERQNGGWKITVRGRVVLETMEARRGQNEPTGKVPVETAWPVPSLPSPRNERTAGASVSSVAAKPAVTTTALGTPRVRQVPDHRFGIADAGLATETRRASRG